MPEIEDVSYTDDKALISGAAYLSAVSVVVMDMDGKTVYEGDASVQSGKFSAQLPKLDDGLYTLILTGSGSWGAVSHLDINTGTPEIVVDSEYSEYYYPGYCDLFAVVGNADAIVLTLNGTEIPYMELCAAEGDVGVSAYFELKDGDNELVIQAVSPSGKTDKKTITIKSDPAGAGKATPRIIDISLHRGSEVSKATAVTVWVEGSDEDGIKVEFYGSGGLLAAERQEDGVYVFNIKPGDFEKGEQTVYISAVNKWGQHDIFAIPITVKSNSALLWIIIGIAAGLGVLAFILIRRKTQGGRFFLSRAG
jgi:hypothetical protein